MDRAPSGDSIVQQGDINAHADNDSETWRVAWLACRTREAADRYQLVKQRVALGVA